MAANVGAWERSCVCFVGARFEALGCQDEVCLVVNLPTRGMPGCCPRQLVGVESVGEGESMALCEFYESPPSVVCLSNVKSSYCPCPVLICVMAYFNAKFALNYKYIFLWSLWYDIIKLLIELFDLLVLTV